MKLIGLKVICFSALLFLFPINSVVADQRSEALQLTKKCAKLFLETYDSDLDVELHCAEQIRFLKKKYKFNIPNSYFPRFLYKVRDKEISLLHTFDHLPKRYRKMAETYFKRADNSEKMFGMEFTDLKFLKKLIHKLLESDQIDLIKSSSKSFIVELNELEESILNEQVLSYRYKINKKKELLENVQIFFKNNKKAIVSFHGAYVKRKKKRLYILKRFEVKQNIFREYSSIIVPRFKNYKFY